MAKNVERGAKSNAVREYLTANPDAGPTEVVTALGKNGLEVTPALVSNLKGKLATGKKGRKAKTTAKRGRPANSGKSKSVSNGQISVSGHQLLLARDFVAAIGGVEIARTAISDLEQFQTN